MPIRNLEGVAIKTLAGISGGLDGDRLSSSTGTHKLGVSIKAQSIFGCYSHFVLFGLRHTSSGSISKRLGFLPTFRLEGADFLELMRLDSCSFFAAASTVSILS